MEKEIAAGPIVSPFSAGLKNEGNVRPAATCYFATLQ
jgi:hypothetical protein